eukprot:scaffold652326_cov38-Prasinocladus_malaysianus.AAC.1
MISVSGSPRPIFLARAGTTKDGPTWPSGGRTCVMELMEQPRPTNTSIACMAAFIRSAWAYKGAVSWQAVVNDGI